jgi:carbamoyltransferase
MVILGINAFHGDSSAAILVDGRLVAAVEEERFRRIKHWAGFPSQAIAYCLAEAKLSLADVDHVAINQLGSAHLGRKALYVLGHPRAARLVVGRLQNRQQRRNVVDLLNAAFPGSSFKGTRHAIEHHRAHLSSAFHVSPFDEAAVVSMDGFGDFASAAWGVGSGTNIRVDGQVFFPHSLGIFYEAMTQYIGFPHYGDEYKVMGLAPYGKPTYLNQMRKIVRLLPGGQFALDLRYFAHQGGVSYQWADNAPVVGELFTPALAELLGPRRNPADPLEDKHRDIAHSVQAMYEEAFFHLLLHLREKHALPNVALAGGCAMNSVANGKIRRRTPFRHVYVQSAAGDAGGAIGAAFGVWHDLGGARRFVMDHAYWGPHYDSKTIAALVEANKDRIAEAGCSVNVIADEGELCKSTSRAIAEGKVVGWFQGRLEWGPRALGNRSIVCDPRRADMKAILNAKIKRRESFRPFAPSVMAEYVSQWFEENDDVPFMMQVFQIRKERRSDVPAVTHVDGSGRLQTVHKETNPLYHALIEAFRKRTNVPMVLNTSFNENEPVVCQPSEALDCFLRTNMDVLVLGNTVISRD